MEQTNNETNSNSLLHLYKWRSIVAFIACLADLVLSVSVIFYSIAWHTKAGSEFNAFHYYTTDSNCYNALVACMMIPFAVEGIRKRRFSYPRWLAVLHFSSTFCITITMGLCLLYNQLVRFWTGFWFTVQYLSASDLPKSIAYIFLSVGMRLSVHKERSPFKHDPLSCVFRALSDQCGLIEKMGRHLSAYFNVALAGILDSDDDLCRLYFLRSFIIL